MKKGSGTRRLLAVVLTAAMLLQNSAGVLATDGTGVISNPKQEQSAEQPGAGLELQGANAIAEQPDAEALDSEDSDAGAQNNKDSDGKEAPGAGDDSADTSQNSSVPEEAETKAPETKASEPDATTAGSSGNAGSTTETTGTDMPQTTAPETQVSETSAPQTEEVEAAAPEPDAPETQGTSGTQETPGLTQTGKEADSGMSGNGTSGGETAGGAESGSAGETNTAGTNAAETNTAGIETADSETGNEAADATTGIGENAIAPIDLPVPIAGDVTITYEAHIGDVEMVGELGGGTVTPESEVVPYGATSVNGSTAKAATGYEFVQWAYRKPDGTYGYKVSGNLTINNTAIVKKQPETDKFTQDMTFLALFRKTQKTITVKTSDASAGKVRADAGNAPSVEQLVIPVGDSVNATTRACKAIVADKHEFKGWRLENGKDYFSTKIDLDYGTIYEAVTKEKPGETVTFTENVVIIADFETDKNKHIGFNLINSCDIFDDITGLHDEGQSSGGGQKYSYTEVAYALGDTYTVPKKYVPHCTKNEHVFVGWFDKRGGKKKGKDDVAIVLRPGEEGIYNNSSAVQTLDAIWISVSASDITTVYDGEFHKPTSDSDLSVENSDNRDYTTDVKNALKSQYGIDVDNINIESKYGDGPVPESGFVDVGEYRLKYSYTVAGKSASKEVTVKITPRPVSVSKSGTLVYTGQPQTLSITGDDIASGDKTASGDRGLLDHHSLTVSAGITGTDAGTYSVLNDGSMIKVIDTAKSGDEADVTNNYNVSVTGTLTITPAQGEGTVSLDDWTYGDKAKAEAATVTKGVYAEPAYYYKKEGAPDSSYTSAKPTDAGSYVVKAVWAATKNYQQLEATDTFTIFKRKIEVYREETQIHDAKKTYVMEIKATDIKKGSSLASGDTLKIEKAQIKGTEIGTYLTVEPASPSWSVQHGSKDVSANYELKISGKLTINPSITYVLNGRNDEAGIYVTKNDDRNLVTYTPGVTTFTFLAPTYEVHATGNSEKGIEPSTHRYQFDGWYTDAGFAEASRKAGITADDKSDVTVYAKWRAVGVVRYWLMENDATWDRGDDAERIVSDGGSKKNYIDCIDNFTDGTDGTLSGVKTFTTPKTDPERVGYTFGGWKHDSWNGANPVQKNKTFDFPYPGDYDSVTGEPDRLTLKAQWTPYTYSVTFDKNLDGQAGGDDQTGTQLFTYGAAAELNKTGEESGKVPVVSYTRAGYTFLGWAKTPNAKAADYQNGEAVLNWQIDGKGIAWATNGAGTVDNGKSLTLYAVWEPSQYTVRFEKNVQNPDEVTGTMADQAFVYDVEQALNANQYERTGYTFGGWTKTAGGSVKNYDDRQSVKNLTEQKDGVVTLYALWIPQTYSVTFHRNDGTAPETAKTVTFQYGTKYKLNTDPDTFKRAGYTLLGWTTEANGTSVVCTDAADVSDWTATEGGKAVLSWNESNHFHVDLYAVWGYKIKFHINAGDVDTTAEQDGLVWNQSAQLQKNAFDVSKKTFMGWMTKADGTATDYADGATVRNLTVDEDGYAHLYARWLDRYTVTYVLNGKTKSPYSVTNPPENLGEYTPGVTEFAFQDPTYKIDLEDGSEIRYVFLGWYTENNAGERKTGITLKDSGDITVYARWRAEGKVRYWLHASDKSETITWQLGADAGRIQTDTPTLNNPGYRGPYYIDTDYYNGIANNEKTVYGKSQFQIPTAVPVRTGYDFDYWYTESSNNALYNKELQPGLSYEFPYSGSLSKEGKPNTFTMHAHWTPYTYAAKFHKNADETMETVSMERFSYGEAGTLGNVTFTREGYTFKGWAKSPGGPVLFKDSIPVLNWKAGADSNPLITWVHEKDAAVDLYAIWEPDFQVKATGFDVVYDGQPHAVVVEGIIAGDVVKYSYSAGGRTYTGKDPVTATDVAESAGTVTVTVTRGGVDDTMEVPAVIRKRPVTLKSVSRTKEFDGEALTNGGASLELNGRNNAGPNTGWAAGEGLNESGTVFHGTITLPGTAKNTFDYKLTDKTKAGNYEISVQEGTLTVTDRVQPYEITVTANSGTKTYNGESQSVSGFEKLNFTVDGCAYTVAGLTADGSGRDAGEYTVGITGEARVLTADGEDVTAQFRIRKVPGKLTIGPRALTLTSGSSMKRYDGKALTDSRVSVSEPGFADGEGAVYKVTGSQMTPGSSKNTFTYELQAGTRAENYAITTAEGTLTVIGREDKFAIVAEARSDSLKYDGKSHTVSGLVQDTFEIGGQKYTLEGLSASVSGTDAGSYEVKVTGTPKVRDASGNDVSSQFEVSTRNGTLEILRRTVVLESGSAVKKYTGDGKPLTAPAVTMTGDGFVEGEASAAAVGSIVYAGETVNTIRVTEKSGYKASNYDISRKEGTLCVTDGTQSDPVDPKLVVTKTHDSRQFGAGETVTFTVTVKNIYNEAKTITLTEQEGVTFVETASGKYQASLGNGGRTATFANVPSGEQVTITAVYKVTDAAVKEGSFTNKVTAAFSGTDKTFTGSDTVDQIDRSCTYTVKFVNRKNNQELRSSIGPVAAGYGTVVTEETRNADGMMYKDIRIPGYKYVGHDNALTVTTAAGGNVFALYYEPDLAGIEVSGFDVVYDGKRHVVRVSGTIAGDVVTYSYTAGGEAHTGTSVVAATDVAESVGNVTVTVKRGSAEQSYMVPAVIHKRKVLLESAKLTKEFDGTPLTNGDVPLVRDGYADAVETLGAEEGWADGEGFSCEFYGEIIWPGSCDNVFDYTLTNNTKPGNYEITCKLGTLKISNPTAPYEITVEANSGTFTYDGGQKTVSGLKGESNGSVRFVADGRAYIITGLQALGTQTDAGTYTVAISGKERIEPIAERGKDVTKLFTVHKVPGSLTIKPRPVTLRSGSSTKEYDGIPLKNSSVTAAGFVGNDGVFCTATGSQTLPGSSRNTFSYRWNEGTRAENYIVSKQEGLLTVTDRAAKYALTLRAKSAAYTYDGTEKTVSGFESLSFTVNGKNYTVEGLDVSVSATNVKEGGYPTVVSGTARVLDEFGNDVTAQFSVRTEAGVLTIKKRPVTLRSADKTKQYDGTALVNGTTPLVLDGRPDPTEILGEEEGWADGEGIQSCAFTDSQTETGSTLNRFSYVLMEGTLEENYEIMVKYGTLSVVDRNAKYKLTVRAKSLTCTYDGTEKSVDGFETLTFDVAGQNYTVYGLTAQRTEKNAGVYTVSVSGRATVLDESGHDVTAQFDIALEEGSLTINRRSVKLRSADLEKTYDGTPLRNEDTSLAQDGYPDEEFAGGDEGWADGEGIILPCSFTGSQTNVGSSENKFDYTLQENTLADNYSVTVEFGALTVTARTEKFAIDVTAASGEFLYDGTEKTVSGFVGAEEASGDGGLKFVVNGETYTVKGLSASASATDAKEGGYPVTVEGTPQVLDAGGTDVTGEFTVNTHDGLLTIDPRQVILTSASAEMKYDGSTLSEPEVVVEGDGFAYAAGENGSREMEASVAATGSITYVGSVKNTIEIKGGSNYKAQNYKITRNEGVLTITDGTAANPLNPDYVVTKTHDESAEYKAGDTVTFTVEATNIYQETKTLTLTEQEGVSFAGGTSGESRVFLSEDRRTATFENVPSGAQVTIEAVYTVTDADVKRGSYVNELTVEFSGEEKTFRGSDTVDKIDRDCTYVVRFVELGGALERKPGDLREEIGPVTVKYGTVVDGMTTTGSTMANDTMTAEVEVPYCEIEIPGYRYVGTSDPLTVTTNTAGNEFFVYYEKGSSTSKLSVEGVDKTYDGKEASVTVEGLLEDDEVIYSYTVVEEGEEKRVTTEGPLTLKEVKDSIGKVTVTVKRRDGIWTQTVEATIRARRVVLQSADLSKKYDGQPLENGDTPLVLDGVADAEEVLGEQEGWAEGEHVSYRFSGSQTEVGSSANAFEVVAEEGTDLSNYAIEKTEGKLTVTPAESETETEKKPETEKPETEKPETEKTETEKPETEKPETEKPETEKPETEKPETEPSKKAGAKLTVTKSIINAGDRHLLGLDGALFYVALFSDAKLTKRVGGIRRLDFDLNTAVASVTYKNLNPGTYYVSEVDADGSPVESGQYGGGAYAASYADGVQKVTIAKGDRSVNFSFENQFLELPGAQYYRDLGLPEDETELETEPETRPQGETQKQTEAQSGSQQTDTVDAGAKAVETGDGTPVEWMLLLFAISGLALLLVQEKKRRKVRA